MKSKKVIILLCILFIYCNIVSSQSQSITWQRSYGDPGAQEIGISIIQTPDDGFITVGTRGNTSQTMRLDKYGNVIWTKYFGGYQAFSIVKSLDGNYLISCESLILKINIDGDTIWTRPFTQGGIFKLTNDNGFYLCGGKQISSFLFNPYIRKFDSLGYVQWDRIYNQSIYDGTFTDMYLDSSNNIILIGNLSDSTFISDKPFIMKTDSLGNPIWFNQYDTLKYLYLNRVLPHPDGGYLVNGFNYFLKFNSIGILQWINFQNNKDTTESIESIIETSDGGVASTGFYHIIGNNPYFVRLLKCDFDGNKVWSRTYGFNNSDYGIGITQTSDSGYAIVGWRGQFNYGDTYVIKTDKTGYANPPVSIGLLNSKLPEEIALLQNYPNPFNPTTTISYQLPKAGLVQITIYDLTGKKIIDLVNEYKQAGSYKTVFEGSNLPSGVYFYKFTAGDFEQTRRMVLLK